MDEHIGAGRMSAAIEEAIREDLGLGDITTDAVIALCNHPVLPFGFAQSYTGKSNAAEIHNGAEPGPICAAAASHRMPTTAAVLNRIRSHTPSSRSSCCTISRSW